MKTFRIIFKSVLTAFILLISSNLFSTAIVSVEINPVDNEKVFLLTVETEGSGNIDIRIKDTDGRVIFSDQHESLSSFVKKIDLKSFESGDYVFELEDELFINSTPIRVGQSGLTVDESGTSRFFKPVFKWNEDNRRLDVNWLLDDKKTVSVIIADEATNIVHQARMKNQFIVSKRYNLEDLKAGNYYILVKTKDWAFKKEVRIH